MRLTWNSKNPDDCNSRPKITFSKKLSVRV